MTKNIAKFPVIDIMTFVKKYGTQFRIIDEKTIEVSMKSGHTKTFYLDDKGEIFATSETIDYDEENENEIQ